jgi:hypothetical protein
MDNLILRSGGANHIIDDKLISGKLDLYSDKLIFQVHKFHNPSYDTEILLSEIQKIEFFNTLDFVPNGLTLVLKDGSNEKFTLNFRKGWRSEIEDLIAQNTHAL